MKKFIKAAATNHVEREINFIGILIKDTVCAGINNFEFENKIKLTTDETDEFKKMYYAAIKESI